MVPVSFKVHADFLCLSRHLYIIIQFFYCGWCMYKRRSLFQSGQKVRPGNRGQEAIDPDWAFVLAGLHYCALLSRITLSSLGINFKETHTGKCVGTREAVNGDTNIFLSKGTLKYHWRLVHFKCLHCCTALLGPLLRPCLISSPHF